ncbi:hypothetical protein Tco_0519197 [Tanacetum coccineum]
MILSPQSFAESATISCWFRGFRVGSSGSWYWLLVWVAFVIGGFAITISRLRIAEVFLYTSFDKRVKNGLQGGEVLWARQHRKSGFVCADAYPIQVEGLRD